ncbi:MAG: DUF2961 domain-containing protein [Planctomycetota bacterium]
MHAFALLLVQSPSAQAVDLGRLLAEKADPACLARLAEPPYRLRGLSASRPSEENHGETAIAELEGPGALVRIETRGAAGTIRIRIDGAEEPVLARATEKGWILDLPIPFAARCRVTADGTSPESCAIEYRAYPAGTSVVSATRAALEGVEDAPRQAVAGTDTFTFSLSEELPEGGLTSLDPKNSAGPRAITRLHLRADATDLVLALRRATLRLVFDGETTVECPLGDFFACPNGPEPHESQGFAVAAGIDEPTGRPGTQIELVCRLVMPYRERFDLSIDARGAGDLHVAGIVRTMPWTWDERSMRFHAATRVQGAGVLVGEWLTEAPGGSVSRRSRALDGVPFESAAEIESILGPRSMAYYYALPSPARGK